CRGCGWTAAWCRADRWCAGIRPPTNPVNAGRRGKRPTGPYDPARVRQGKTMPTRSINPGLGASGSPVVAAVLVLAFVLAAWLGVAQNRAPSPVGADAAADAFSSARAMGVLERVLGDQRPHPTGSPANAAVRDAIVA